MSITPRAPIGSLLKGDPLGLKKKLVRPERQPVKTPARAVVTKPQASAPAKKGKAKKKAKTK